MRDYEHTRRVEPTFPVLAPVDIAQNPFRFVDQSDIEPCMFYLYRSIVLINKRSMGAGIRG